MDFDLMITSLPKLLSATVITLKLLSVSLIIGMFLILTIATGTYVFAPEISKHIPQAENSLKIYKSKVTYVFSNIKDSYMEFVFPKIDKFL